METGESVKPDTPAEKPTGDSEPKPERKESSGPVLVLSTLPGAETSSSQGRSDAYTWGGGSRSLDPPPWESAPYWE